MGESFTEVYRLGATGMIAYCIHYASAKVYSAVCAPSGLAGFLYGLVTVASPVCSTALSALSHTQNLYANFVVFGLSRLLVELVGKRKTS